ncbi:MAG: serine/threonine-protein phosphatase, partial [Sinomonas sp.]|nr:serine/threonine-protein phosphatase [Sinomonas sp.]
TDIQLSSLPDFQQQRLRVGIPTNSLSEAVDIVATLKSNPQSCLSAPSPSASGASAGASVSPSAVPPPSPSASATPSASPSPTNPCLGGQ